MTRSQAGSGSASPPPGKTGRRRRPMVRAAIALVGVGTIGVFATSPLAIADGAPSVVALWHLDEPTGSTTMLDSSGLQVDGSIGDAVRTGVVGADGSTGYLFTQPSGAVRVPDNPALNPWDQPIAVSARLLVSSTLPAGDYNVVQKGAATAVGGAYKLEIYARARSTKFGFPACAFNGAAGRDRVYGPQSVADGQWHQVVCNLTATQAFVTVDGRSGPSVSRQASTISNTDDLTIGGKPATGSHGYVGVADEISITIG